MTFLGKESIKKSFIGTVIVTSIFVTSIVFPYANTTYRVVSGDTLSGIAQKHSITLEELYQANPKYRTSSLIMIGDIINIPSKGPQTVTYTVQRGDVLSVIAQRHGVTTRAIMDANGIVDANRIFVGQILTIPLNNQQPAPVPAPPAPPQQTNTTYTVQRGDVLSVIAQRYGVTTRAIMDANGIVDANRIFVGQVLIIPINTQTPAPAPVPSQPQQTTYVVKQGDTPWTISNQFGVSLNDFLTANSFSQNVVINIGQVVIIPQITPQTPISRGGQTRPRVTYITHIVAAGDNLWTIGIRYGIPMEELRVLNGFSSNHILHIGDKVTIPVYNIPVKETPGPRFGELLDWWTEAQYLLPLGKVFTVEDFHTGKRWQMKRTIGANHADVEPLTAADTAIMKEVWGGNWSWAVRPVIVEVDGRRIAASANGMPHDIQYITNNNYNGHSCIHFLNSTLHKDGTQVSSHQNAVLVAAGLK